MSKKLTPQKIPEDKMVDWLASLLFNTYLINLKNNNYVTRKTAKNG